MFIRGNHHILVSQNTLEILLLCHNMLKICFVVKTKNKRTFQLLKYINSYFIAYKGRIKFILSKICCICVQCNKKCIFFFWYFIAIFFFYDFSQCQCFNFVFICNYCGCVVPTSVSFSYDEYSIWVHICIPIGINVIMIYT